MPTTVPVAVVMLTAVAGNLVAPAQSFASDTTDITSAYVSNFVMGAQSSKSFTVTAKVTTTAPTTTDVSYRLSSDYWEPDCDVVKFGYMQHVAGSLFQDTVVITQADIEGNACAGPWTLETLAFNEDGSSSDSDERTVYFKRRSRLVDMNASPEPVSRGDTVYIKADLQRVDWNTLEYRALSGRRVELQFKPTGGSYVTIESVTSSSTGRVRTAVSQSRGGCYRWLFRGSSTTAPAGSSGDCVEVR